MGYNASPHLHDPSYMMRKPGRTHAQIEVLQAAISCKGYSAHDGTCEMKRDCRFMM
jgi:hypothetical protein